LAKVIVGMTISLDGFVADRNGNAGRLYPDLAALKHTAYYHPDAGQVAARAEGSTFLLLFVPRTERPNSRETPMNWMQPESGQA
jgi:hypothetical protein